MPGIVCGGELEEEITQEEWDGHILEVRKIFNVVVVGEKQDKEIGHTALKHRKRELIKIIKSRKPNHTIFRNLKEERYARTEFLLRHEQEMQDKLSEYRFLEKAGAIINRSTNVQWFRGTIDLQKPVGVGVMGEANIREKQAGSDFDLHQNIKSVSFCYYYQTGYWFEYTGFPDLKKQHQRYGESSTYIASFITPP